MVEILSNIFVISTPILLAIASIWYIKRPIPKNKKDRIKDSLIYSLMAIGIIILNVVGQLLKKYGGC